jgi:hypothetical protein
MMKPPSISFINRKNCGRFKEAMMFKYGMHDIELIVALAGLYVNPLHQSLLVTGSELSTCDASRLCAIALKSLIRIFSST